MFPQGAGHALAFCGQAPGGSGLRLAVPLDSQGNKGKPKKDDLLGGGLEHRW